ncbi:MULTISPECIES: chorismate transformation enzyme, FkbO/Hyg5 family [Xanthomonas translucens group]|uniref:chorismate transformation enzyme, FkbO/Hyg5 family n=1 Tax=Xanthomonas translucens group TaxID=3390202 RepID=UPI00057912CB|nr:pteridine-dependent deoxygenase [Xanthomonas translucens]UKE47094.1 pteridine-dependent deoxygenase [Xanthomonas translucens pv. cerealis]UKE69433.1 pteridine-dependent deoxygenase [Xanthomonas translucens pv. pistacia]
MSRPHPPFAHHEQRHPRLQVDYVAETNLGDLLRDERVLAVFGFGNDAPRHHAPRYLRVPLQPYGPRMLEVWRTDAPVSSGRDGDIAWASDGHLQFGVIEIDEQALAIEDASALAYAQITAFVASSATPRMLRIWNYLDAITLGNGDRERYRQFCVGRARGLGDFDASQLPAATAVGRCDDARVMQIYWLAAAQAGTPLENPRQVSAYRYPRQYGPQSPSFARAMLPPAGSDMPLLLSGTASVVGHASMHSGQLLAQLEETFANFDALLAAARTHRPDLPAQFGDGTRLKVYVREAADLPLVAAALDARFGARVPRLLLHAVICRNELAVEIDGVHG